MPHRGNRKSLSNERLTEINFHVVWEVCTHLSPPQSWSKINLNCQFANAEASSKTGGKARVGAGATICTDVKARKKWGKRNLEPVLNSLSVSHSRQTDTHTHTFFLPCFHSSNYLCVFGGVRGRDRMTETHVCSQVRVACVLSLVGPEQYKQPFLLHHEDLKHAFFFTLRCCRAVSIVRHDCWFVQRHVLARAHLSCLPLVVLITLLSLFPPWDSRGFLNEFPGALPRRHWPGSDLASAQRLLHASLDQWPGFVSLPIPLFPLFLTRCSISINIMQPFHCHPWLNLVVHAQPGLVASWLFIKVGVSPLALGILPHHSGQLGCSPSKSCPFSIQFIFILALLFS